MKIIDVYGEYHVSDHNVEISHTTIHRIRELHVTRNNLDKRHPGINHDTIERTMRLRGVQ